MHPAGLPLNHVTRRAFLESTALAIGAVAWSTPASLAAAASGSLAALPRAEGPPATPLPHFPSRLHAFVWRNWPLVPVERIASVVNASRHDIGRLASAMGLPDQPRISREQEQRSYITVIKRNWHLLPYAQLLALLDWTPEHLAFTLREDDFLFVKLGGQKPSCAPLTFAPPDPAIIAAEERIRHLLQQHLPGRTDREPPFAFVRDLSSRVWRQRARPQESSLRLCYSYFALYGDPLLQPELEPYPSGYLARLRASGVNAVWLQGVLHKLAPFPWNPALSTGHEERLKNLRQLVRRASEQNIAVYLYLNEPRAMPLPFFNAHPELKGVVEGDHATLCTSLPAVQRWMRQSMQTICSAVPDLGGFFTITASENLTSCWSHGAGGQCRRCARRGAAAVISEVNGVMAAGVRDALGHPSKRNGGAKENKAGLPRFIAWDWGWSDAWAGDAINALPMDCALMSVSEWNMPIRRGGVRTVVGEYSVSAVGPGPRATRHWALARRRGLRTVAKIQANNSWELSAVPYLPAVANVAEHAADLSAAGVHDIMLGWTLGGHPSPNLQVVAEATRISARAVPAERQANRAEIVDAAMRHVALERYGPGLAAAVVDAWKAFSSAFREFPFHIGVVYTAPLQVGPANLLWPRPTRQRASMVGFPHDDLTMWRAVYAGPTFAAQLEKVAAGFESARLALARAPHGKTGKREEQLLAAELRLAEAAEVHFQSVANQARFVMARDALAAAKTAEAAHAQIGALERMLAAELNLALRLHALQLADSRIGFEASNQYYYLPIDLLEKVLNCRDLLERWIPAEKRRWRT